MTNTQKLARIKRLMWVKERQRDVARGALAEATRLEERAQHVQQEAEDDWVRCAREAVEQSPTSVADFAAQREQLRQLRHQADLAERRRQEAERRARQQREQARSAQRELRKMEIWSDGVTEVMLAENIQRDRKQCDEFAAQIELRKKTEDGDARD